MTKVAPVQFLNYSILFFPPRFLVPSPKRWQNLCSATFRQRWWLPVLTRRLRQCSKRLFRRWLRNWTGMLGTAVP